MNLKTQTIKLQDKLHRLKDRFIKCKPPEIADERKFFTDMKEETKPTYQLLDQWRETTLHYIDTNESLLYEQQILATVENIEMIILHSYYIDVRRRFFMEYFNSVNYIFEQLLKELGEEMNEK